MKIDLYDFIKQVENCDKDECERQIKELRKIIQKAIDDELEARKNKRGWFHRK